VRASLILSLQHGRLLHHNRIQRPICVPTIEQNYLDLIDMEENEPDVSLPRETTIIRINMTIGDMFLCANGLFAIECKPIRFKKGLFTIVLRQCQSPNLTNFSWCHLGCHCSNGCVGDHSL
jgi:hypothetical protein